MPTKEILDEILKKLLGDKLNNLEKKGKTEMDDLKLIKTSYDNFNKSIENLVKLREAKILKDKLDLEKKQEEKLRRNTKSITKREFSTAKKKSLQASKTERHLLHNISNFQNESRNTLKTNKSISLLKTRAKTKSTLDKVNIRNLNTSQNIQTITGRGTVAGKSIKDTLAKLNKNNNRNKPRNTITVIGTSRDRGSKSVAIKKPKNLLKNKKITTDNKKKEELSSNKKENLQDIVKNINLEEPLSSTNTEAIPITITKKVLPSPCFRSIVTTGIFDKTLIKYLDRESLFKIAFLKRDYLTYMIENLKNVLSKVKQVSQILIGETIDDKINALNSKYPAEELSSQIKTFAMSRGCVKAINMIDNDMCTRIFTKPLKDENLHEIALVYRIYCQLLKYNDLISIENDKVFWEKFSKFIMDNKGDKLNIFVINSVTKFQFDDKNVFKLKEMAFERTEKLKPTYYGKICGATGLFVFLIKDALEYCGAIEDKKTPPNRIKANLNYEKIIYDRISSIIEKLEKYVKNEK